MAYSFSANQFEKQFKPTCLGNWEVAKWFPERPRAHKTPTKIIVNDRGHLLPGVQRPSKSPWGSYRGTWQLPDKISRQTALEITAPQVRARRSWEKRSSHVPILTSELTEEQQDNENLEESIGDSDALDNQTHPDDGGHEIQVEKSCSPSSYHEEARQPYDHHADDDYSRPKGQERSPGVTDTLLPIQNSINEYNKHCKPSLNEGQRLRDNNNNNNNNNVNIYTNVNESSKETKDIYIKGNGTGEEYKTEMTSDKIRNMPPLATAYCNPQIARNLAIENLKHHPLPDTVDDALYCSSQMKKDQNPGRHLDVEPRAAAIGCKGYGTPGPTQCSKLKVYRPKTAGVIPNKENIKDMTRPKTSNSDYRNKHLSQMQLALCWDLKPPNASDEPKRSPHIDGSNGSAAPAVFALVQPPDDKIESYSAVVPNKQHRHSQNSIKSASNSTRSGSAGRAKLRSAWDSTDNKELQRQRGANPSAVMDIINNNDIQLEPIHQNQQNAKENIPPPTSPSQKEKKKNDVNNSANTSINSGKLLKKQHHQSTPNLSNGSDNNGNLKNNLNVNGKNKLLNNRPCMACGMKTSSSVAGSGSNKSNKLENGDNENNNISHHTASVNSMSSGRSNKANNIQVPKPRTPYAKRSYSIGTLAPPFSLWPGTTGQDYPEHWRLASVYQHSYKPIHSRRKKFLQSVYQ
ncbi:uncharacterized protein LOC142330677 [Lycorma delicatula]|uniref:uncharacterized protein LOC142330677 n=1 Tax=Lycorma delicatula TaxID=130591 RepID=UPI003F513193